MTSVVRVLLIGGGATICIDVWALLLRSAFSVRSLDYCLLGRWLLHMRDGRLVHASIVASAAKPHECLAGWVTHYSIGVAFSLLFVLVAPGGWLGQPTLIPALLFGAATVVVPFFTMQPAFGLGVAASRAPSPWKARLKSLATHTMFGLGLFVTASLLR